MDCDAFITNVIAKYGCTDNTTRQQTVSTLLNDPSFIFNEPFEHIKLISVTAFKNFIENHYLNMTAILTDLHVLVEDTNKGLTADSGPVRGRRIIRIQPSFFLRNIRS